MNGEKRYIPGTNPEWGRELPEGYSNSLVDAAGNNWDNGYNFDEKDDDEVETVQRELGEAAQKALEQTDDTTGETSTTSEN